LIEINMNVRLSIERAYRAHWGELTAVLSSQFGASQLDLVEAVVQEAFVKAMERWPVEGVPEKPVAWLLTVARHLRVDHARRQQTAAVHQEEVERSLAATFDPTNGGFGRAPKFPNPPALELLLRYHRHAASVHALKVTLTLEKMAAGGIHDQVGGGFHRYTTDAAWQVPHLEKTLYDNAQLAALYLATSQVTKRDDFAEVTRDIRRAGDDGARRGLLRRHGCGQRGGRGAVLRLDPRRSARRTRPGARRCGARVLRHHRAGELPRQEHPARRGSAPRGREDARP
jgi:DNA-directed RNA polymerase specialized sigma24 family protein